MQTNINGIKDFLKKVNIGAKIGFFAFIIISIGMTFEGLGLIDNLSFNLVELIIAICTLLFRTFLISVLSNSLITLDTEKLQDSDKFLIVISAYTHYILTKVLVTSTLFVFLEKYGLKNNIKYFYELSLLENYKKSLFIPSAAFIGITTIFIVSIVYMLILNKYKVNKPINYSQDAKDLLSVMNQSNDKLEKKEHVYKNNIANDSKHTRISNKMINNGQRLTTDSRDINHLNSLDYNDSKLDQKTEESNQELGEELSKKFKENTGRKPRY